MSSLPKISWYIDQLVNLQIYYFFIFIFFQNKNNNKQLFTFKSYHAILIKVYLHFFKKEEEEVEDKSLYSACYFDR
jgi:hypothetical protein